MSDWHEDVLGPAFEARPLPQPDGGLATLVRHVAGGPRAAPARPAVLYVHGFVDYFFHPHVAEAFARRGYPFYAVDLRGYGRSIGDGADPNYVPDIALHGRDLDAAVAALREEGHDRVVVLAHSMGGLVASMWAHTRPGRAAALVLNSPWLDLNEGWHHRVVTTRLLYAVRAVAPRLVVGRPGEHYGRALSEQWQYDQAWKPVAGFPVRAAWLHSVRRAHAKVARGLSVDCPVLVLACDRSSPGRRYHDELLTTDSVLSVRHIQDRAPRLGPAVDVEIIPGGAHDLALSSAPAREQYLRTALGWLDKHV